MELTIYLNETKSWRPINNNKKAFSGFKSIQCSRARARSGTHCAHTQRRQDEPILSCAHSLCAMHLTHCIDVQCNVHDSVCNAGQTWHQYRTATLSSKSLLPSLGQVFSVAMFVFSLFVLAKNHQIGAMRFLFRFSSSLLRASGVEPGNGNPIT